jgi:hypothetical protein
MMTDKQIADAKSRLEGAFRPLKCKAEDHDYRAKLRFKVIDESDDTVFEARITDHDVNDAGRFADLIAQATAVVQAKGFVLS